MRSMQYATGKSDLPHSSHSNYAPHAGARQGAPGIATRLMCYVRVSGKWCYLYRVINRDGNLVDSMLSEHRDMASATRFFTGAKDIVGHKPARVTTDGHDSYPRAIRRVLGRKVEHRTNRYLNNRVEQDHRGIKQRYYPMRGFGNFKSASRFCQAFDEQ